MMRRNHSHDRPHFPGAFRRFPAVEMKRLRHVSVHGPGGERVAGVESISPAEVDKTFPDLGAWNRRPREPVGVITQLGPVLRAVNAGSAFESMKEIITGPRISAEAVSGTNRGQQSAAAGNQKQSD